MSDQDRSARFIGTDDDVAIIPPESDTESETRATKALDGTKSTWMAFFKTAVREAMAGRVTQPQALALLSNRLKRSGEDAYRDALRENGITELDEFDQFQLDQWDGEQQGYLRSFVDELYSTGLTPEQADSRATLWADKSLQDAYMAALTSVDKNSNYMWKYSAEAKHCTDCEALDGQVHRLKEWESRDLRPKSDRLDCKLGCKCELIKTTEAAKGRFLGGVLNSLRCNQVFIISRMAV